MDGGIVDNQGIEVIELTEDSMRRKGRALDLVIVSDVSSPYLDAYSPNKQMLPNGIGKWTLDNIQKGVRWGGVLTTLLWIASFWVGNHYLIGAMTVVWGLTAVVNLAMGWSKKKLVKLLSKTIVGSLPAYLEPSLAMQENSRKAASMKTTLWFTQKDKDNGYPEAVFAAGRYTICFNLLKYIEDIQKDGDNTNKNHELIISCKQQLMEAWAKFQENALWND